MDKYDRHYYRGRRTRHVVTYYRDMAVGCLFAIIVVIFLIFVLLCLCGGVFQ